MTIKLYELSGQDRDVRFSPHCWKTRLALVHKQLNYESEGVCLTEKEKIAFSNQPLLPVLTDDDTTVVDSWDIALYLEETYPSAPSLFGDEQTKQDVESIHKWASTALARHVPSIILVDVFNLIREEDREYFRETREARVGKTLEACCSNPQVSIDAFCQELASLTDRLNAHDYLTGVKPNYADIIVLSTILWVEVSSSRKILAEDHVAYPWYQNMRVVYHAAL